MLANDTAYGQFGNSQTGGSLTVRYDRPDGAIGADLGVASWFDGGDRCLRGRLKARITDQTAIYIRGDYFTGDQDTICGSINNLSRISAEYRIQF